MSTNICNRVRVCRKQTQRYWRLIRIFSLINNKNRIHAQPSTKWRRDSTMPEYRYNIYKDEISLLQTQLMFCQFDGLSRWRFESLSPFPGWGETNLCFELWNRGFEKLGVQNMYLERISSGNLGLSCTF